MALSVLNGQLIGKIQLTSNYSITFRTISYSPDSQSYQIIYSTKQFTYLAERNTIFVWDMLFGTLK
jgi:hypothetical protein